MGKKNGEQRHGNLYIKITCILVLEGPGIQFYKSFTIFFLFFFFSENNDGNQRTEALKIVYISLSILLSQTLAAAQ